MNEELEIQQEVTSETIPASSGGGMSRRDFMKILGVGAANAFIPNIGFGVDPGVSIDKGEIWLPTLDNDRRKALKALDSYIHVEDLKYIDTFVFGDHKIVVVQNGDFDFDYNTLHKVISEIILTPLKDSLPETIVISDTTNGGLTSYYNLGGGKSINTIQIAPEPKNLFALIFTHELVHIMQNKKKYRPATGFKASLFKEAFAVGISAYIFQEYFLKNTWSNWYISDKDELEEILFSLYLNKIDPSEIVNWAEVETIENQTNLVYGGIGPYVIGREILIPILIENGWSPADIINLQDYILGRDDLFQYYLGSPTMDLFRLAYEYSRSISTLRDTPNWNTLEACHQLIWQDITKNGSDSYRKTPALGRVSINQDYYDNYGVIPFYTVTAEYPLVVGSFDVIPQEIYVNGSRNVIEPGSWMQFNPDESGNLVISILPRFTGQFLVRDLGIGSIQDAIVEA